MTAPEWTGAVERVLEAAAAASASPNSNGPMRPPTSPWTGAKPDPGQVLSPSQVNTFLDCPAKFGFKYVTELPDPPNAARHVGTCLHKALEAYWRGRISGKTIELAAVQDAFDLAWADREDRVAWATGDNPDELRAEGRVLVEVYLVEVAPGIRPAAVELLVTGRIAGVPVQGFIDLLDVDGRIIDVKTAKKKPSSVRPDYRLQVATYDLLCPQSRGMARLDTIVKTKTVQTVQQTIELGPGDTQYAEAIYPMVRDAIADGVFYPRRDSILCSRKYCAFWRECEREFGGGVRG